MKIEKKRKASQVRKGASANLPFRESWRELGEEGGPRGGVPGPARTRRPTIAPLSCLPGVEGRPGRYVTREGGGAVDCGRHGGGPGHPRAQYTAPAAAVAAYATAEATAENRVRFKIVNYNCKNCKLWLVLYLACQLTTERHTMPTV